MRYRQVYEGEWLEIRRNKFKDACCDCGLVHTINFRIKRAKGRPRLFMQAFRDNRATAGIRRGMKKHPQV